MERIIIKGLLGLLALGLTAACDNTAPHSKTAKVEWDIVMASDAVAYAPRNAGLISMR